MEIRTRCIAASGNVYIYWYSHDAKDTDRDRRKRARNFVYRRRGEMSSEELEEWEMEVWDEELRSDHSQSINGGVSDAKKALVGAGARALFYPTLLYNVVRNKIQSGFHWWDRVDEFILLGAVPFPADVPRLKEHGVGGVVTLNEPYETLVPTSLYQAHNIDHLVIPTRDYLFAPSFNDICRAVNFIHYNASCGKTTYVHCKAGRGRSTTIVLCYLVEHKKMTPDAALEHVKSIRSRVLLASAQKRAVQGYYLEKMKKSGSLGCMNNTDGKSSCFSSGFDDDSMEVLTNSDLKGYSASCNSATKSDADGYDAGCDSVMMVTKAELDGYDRTGAASKERCQGRSLESVGREVLRRVAHF